MPSTRYSVTRTPVAHSSRRKGWHEAGVGLVDASGRLAVMVTVGGYDLLEVDWVAGHVATALAELPDEPPPRPAPLHRT